MSATRRRRRAILSRPARPAWSLVLAFLLTLVLAWRTQAEPESERPTLRLEAAVPAMLDARSAVIYPAQSLPLRFSHARHVSGAGMACVDCHASAPNSIRARDLLTPRMEVCLTCHALADAESGALACATCHAHYDDDRDPGLPPGEPLTAATARRARNPPPGLKLPPAQLSFSHRRHVDAGATCVECHGDMRGVDLATRAQLPSMRECWSCHDDSTPGAPSRQCTTCHLSNRDGRVRTDLPTGALIPTGRLVGGDHRLDFVTHHASTTDSTACQSCHTERFCLDCHNGVVKPASVHPPNYTLSHAIEAQSQSAQCAGCHNLQSFCLGCHELTGVGQQRRRHPVGTQHHPEGFVDQVDSPVFHGPVARLNIAACVSCHQEESCVSCHSGINPHGPDFLARCGAMRTRNESACVRCHITSADRAQIRVLCD